jgi:hypothetical protein
MKPAVLALLALLTLSSPATAVVRRLVPFLKDIAGR